MTTHLAHRDFDGTAVCNRSRHVDIALDIDEVDCPRCIQIYNENRGAVSTNGRTRIKLAVYVDLDPIPGTFHTAESAQHCVRNILNDRIEHYNPTVSIEQYRTN